MNIQAKSALPVLRWKDDRGQTVSQYDTPEKRRKHVENQRRYYLRHPERVNKARRNTPGIAESRARCARLRKKQHPEQRAAWMATYRAIRYGKLKRPKICSKCKRICKPEAHHPDYSKPLDVIWLCRPCHLETEGKKARVYRKGDPKP